MSISFHCERCKKKIKAPDDAGGKYGNCPHCEHRCYVPLPHDDNEPELKLAPVDDNDEVKYSNMMRETYNIRQNILHETAAGEEGRDIPHEPMDEKELIKSIVMYLRMMADGELAQADRMASRIKLQSAAAKDILKKMARTEKPEPELAQIPPRLLLGLMKNLNTIL